MLNHITRLRFAGWIEWRTTEALDQILNWRSCRRRCFCSRPRRTDSSRSRCCISGGNPENSPRSRRRVRWQIGRVKIITGTFGCASGARDHQIKVIGRAMIITRANPLRKVVGPDDGSIVLVGIFLPGMTMDRKHFRVAGAEWVRHAEPHLIARVRLEDWCLRFTDLHRRIGRVSQRVRRHTGNVCSRFRKTMVRRFSAVVDCIDRLCGRSDQSITQHDREFTIPRSRWQSDRS